MKKRKRKEEEEEEERKIRPSKSMTISIAPAQCFVNYGYYLHFPVITNRLLDTTA